MLRQFIKDQRGGPAVSLKGLFTILIILMIAALLIDSIYVGLGYVYIKTQMDMANRAVYRDVDQIRLADRELYIDESNGEDTFYEFLINNLNLNSSLTPVSANSGIVGPIKIIGFEIYNIPELPAITPVGTPVNLVSVHSQIEATIRPIFFGWFTDIKIQPYMDTDLPDKLVKTFHPII